MHHYFIDFLIIIKNFLNIQLLDMVEIIQYIKESILNWIITYFYIKKIK